MTQVVTAKHFRESFSETLNEAVYGKKKILITRNGKSQAMLIGVKDFNPKEFMTEKEWRANIQLFNKIASRGKGTSDEKSARIAEKAIKWARKKKRD